MGDLQTVNVDGTRLAYRAVGRSGAPAMVLLHALGENSGTWDRVATAFADSHRVYPLDLRGHGRSAWPGDYSFELMRDDVLGFLGALGLERVTLVGHSLGGTVAYLVAQERPETVDLLVLEDPPPPFAADPPRQVPECPDGPLPFDWAVVAPITAQRNDPDPAWWDRLTEITAPTLVIGGGSGSHLPQDRIADMAGRIPGGRMVTIPAGHEIHTARHAAYLTEVAAFLDVPY